MTHEPTYCNPVYSGACADPFVLKHRGEYWAYCTGICDDGRAFGILHSTDLVQWTKIGSAIDLLPTSWREYWAPEVSYFDGRFYMYYSAGNEEHMEIRVAIAGSPAGPFVDTGRRLTSEPFAIDAHIFTDLDGQRYMFYATDFLDHSRIGTGTVVDRMLDPQTLEGAPRPVTRALHDWQIYDPQRQEKGGVKWHTIEGPFVLRYKGTYFQMFSGGNWRYAGYGVSYATSDCLNGEREWDQVADGQTVLPILRSNLEVIGPGHNSVVRGPDGIQPFCVYHRWVEGKRVMAIDRLEFVGGRLSILGPTAAPAPRPNPASIAGFAAWSLDPEEWVREGGDLAPRPGLPAAASCFPAVDAFVWEVWARSDHEASQWCLGLGSGGGRMLEVRSTHTGVEIQVLEGTERPPSTTVPFDPTQFHLFRLTVDRYRAFLEVDEVPAWCGHIAHHADTIHINVQRGQPSFSGSALTFGWSELFEGDESLSRRGWEAGGHARWSIDSMRLIGVARGREGWLSRGPVLGSYELVVNGRLLESTGEDGCWGVYPAWSRKDSGPLVSARSDGQLRVSTRGALAGAVELPDGKRDEFRHLRCRKRCGRLEIGYENAKMLSIPLESSPTVAALFVREGIASFDSIRLTQLA